MCHCFGGIFLLFYIIIYIYTNTHAHTHTFFGHSVHFFGVQKIEPLPGWHHLNPPALWQISVLRASGRLSCFRFEAPEVSRNRGTSESSISRWIFHEINHPAIKGYPHFMETKSHGSAELWSTMGMGQS